MKNKNQTSERYLHTTLLSLASIVLILTMIATLAHSAEVSLQWNSVAEADGYNVYYGTASRTYQPPVEVPDQSQTTHTVTLDPGTYYFAVTAYNNYGESGYSLEVGPTTITDTNPVTSVSLTSNLPSPQPENTPVTFTAQAEGGSGNYEYRFRFLDKDRKWKMVQDYSSSPDCSLDVTANIKVIQVLARNAGSVDKYHAYNTIWFSTDMNPITSVSLISDLPSPQPENTPTTFTAQAEGGSGNYEYKFRFLDKDGQWIMAQNYSLSSDYSWNVAANIEVIQVLARNAGSVDRFQAYNSIRFSTDTNPPTSISLISDLPSPQPESQVVTFTAQATGGSENYEYKFWLRSTDGTWMMVQDYSSSPNYTWNATASIDIIQVWARNAASSDKWQVYRTIRFGSY